MSAIKANQVLNLDGDRIGSVVVDSIANMKNLNPEIEANATVELLGYYSKGDGGGGTFYWDSTSIEDDNGGTIIEATGVVDGRWIRNYSGAVNVKWFGAVGDGVVDDTVAFQTALLNTLALYVPSGAYILDIDTHGELTNYTGFEDKGVIIRGCKNTVLRCKHTKAGNYVIRIGGSFGETGPLLENLIIESYTTTAYDTKNYSWNGGTPITSGNNECGAYLASPNNSLVAPTIKNCTFRGFSGQAVLLGSSSNALIDDNCYFSDNLISISLDNTAGYSVTLPQINNNYIQKNKYGITNRDYLNNVGTLVAGGIISNNALDNCDYPIALDERAGGENSNITVHSNWFEGNNNAGYIVTQGCLDLYNVQVGAGMDYQVQDNTNTSNITLNSRGFVVTGQDEGAGGRDVFVVRENGIENCHFDDDGTESAPIIKWWNDRDTGIYRKSDNSLGFVCGGDATLYLENSGSYDGKLRTLRTNIELNAPTNVTLSSDNGGSTRYIQLRPADNGIRIGPDNTLSVGTSALRASVIYAATGAISTSDDREKTYIDITDAEKAVALEIKANMKKFKWNEAIESKGIDKARIHFGTSAQAVKAIFAKHGLDAGSYGLFTYDEWEQEVDEEGVVTLEAGNRYGIRYEELLCFIIGAM